MSIAIVNIIPSKQVESSQTTQYTANGVKTIIDKFTVTNTSTSDVLFNCNLVADGEIAGNVNNIVNDKTIVPDETYTCPELIGHVLKNKSSISTLAGTATALTIRASGREIS